MIFAGVSVTVLTLRSFGGGGGELFEVCEDKSLQKKGSSTVGAGPQMTAAFSGLQCFCACSVRVVGVDVLCLLCPLYTPVYIVLTAIYFYCSPLAPSPVGESKCDRPERMGGLLFLKNDVCFFWRGRWRGGGGCTIMLLVSLCRNSWLWYDFAADFLSRGCVYGMGVPSPALRRVHAVWGGGGEV